VAREAEETLIEQGSGNVFADLGFENPEEWLTKARLASIIQEIIEARGLNQTEAATLMRIDQPKVSKIIRGRLNDFSTERLLNCLLHLGSDVEIVVHRRSSGHGGQGTLRVALVS
jgi:predicted XRE-type DNA-binding protein